MSTSSYVPAIVLSVTFCNVGEDLMVRLAYLVQLSVMSGDGDLCWALNW